MTNSSMNLKEWGLLFCLSVLWGGSFIFTEMALDTLPPLTFVFGRVLVAALALIVIVYLSGYKMPTSWSLWLGFLVMGFINNIIPFSLISWGQVYIDGGLAAILNSTTPLFSIILAHFLTDVERITPNRLLGILCGIAGVIVLIGPDSLTGMSFKGLGQFAILGASLFYALSAIYARRFNHLPPMVSAASMLTCSAIMMLPLALIVDRPWQLQPNAIALGAVLGTALLSTVVAYIIYYRLLTTTGPTNLMLVTLLIPLNAIIIGGFVLDERLEWSMVLGMFLIFLGLIAIDGRLWRSLRRLQRGYEAAPLP